MSKTKKNNQNIAENGKPKMRQIIIETDGNSINISKSETSGVIELIAILQSLVVYLQRPKQ